MIVHITSQHPREDTRIYKKEILSLKAAYRCPIVLLVSDGAGNERRSEGVEVFDADLMGLTRLKRIRRFYRYVFRFLRNHRPAVMHFHDPELIPIACLLSLIGYKCIYDAHEDMPALIRNRERLPRSLARLVEIFLRLAQILALLPVTAIVAATPAIEKTIRHRNVGLVQNFPLKDELKVPSLVPFDQRPPKVIFTGYLTRIRGAVEMLEAIALVNEQDVKCSLSIAGPINDADLLRNLESHRGWRWVEYHGFSTREKMANEMSKSVAGLILFHPLPNHTTAQPNKMFEYMSCGLPVIASNFPLWKNIIEGIECGVTVNPFDAQSIADEIRNLLVDRNTAHDQGRNGVTAVENKFNWNSEQKALVDLYKRIDATPAN